MTDLKDMLNIETDDLNIINQLISNQDNRMVAVLYFA